MKIITDTGSDILEIEAKAMGVDLVPISANFEDVIFDRNTEENFKAFYEKLRSEEQLPVSSQPSPAAFLEKYEAAEETGEEVLVILISSKLSGTYNGAVLAKEMCGYEKIYIVDSLQASLSLRLLVEYAVKLKEEGKSAAIHFSFFQKCLHSAFGRFHAAGFGISFNLSIPEQQHRLDSHYISHCCNYRRNTSALFQI